MKWKFILANSKDLSAVGELRHARSRSLNLLLNRGGEAKFEYPMTADLAEYINTYSSAILAYRYNWRETRDWRLAGNAGDVWNLKWSGYVSTIDEDITGNKMTVSSVGWINRLAKRLLRRDRNYLYAAGVSTDDSEIIYDLLSEANGIASGEIAAGTNSVALADGYVVYWPAGSSPNTSTWIKKGSLLPNEGVGGATVYVPAYRGKNLTKWSQILPAMIDMTDLENGCDIHVDPKTRELNIYRKRRIIRDDVIFGYKWGPNNIASLGRQIDGSVQVNYGLATGRAGTQPKYQDDLTSQQQYGPLEEMFSLGDVQDISTQAGGAATPQSVLWTYAAGEVALRAQSRQIFSFTPFPYYQEGRVPEPLVDYDIGDQVRLTAKHPPRVDVNNLGVRVFGLNITIDDKTGAEKINALQITPGA